MMNICETQNLFETIYENGHGERFEATYGVIYQWLHQQYGMLMGVILLCAVVAVMLWLFIGYHLHLIRKGFTTNESSKFSHYSHYLKMTSEFFAEWEQMRLKDPEANPDDDDIEYFRVEKEWKMKQI